MAATARGQTAPPALSAESQSCVRSSKCSRPRQRRPARRQVDMCATQDLGHSAARVAPHQQAAAGRWVLHLACRCEVLHAVILLVPSGSACTAALPPTLMSGYALQIEEAQAALSAKEAEVEDLKQKMAEGLSEAQVFVTSHVQPCCTACSCTVIDSACHVGIAPSQRHWWLAHTARVCTDEVPSRPLDAEAQCCSTLQMALM